MDDISSFLYEMGLVLRLAPHLEGESWVAVSRHGQQSTTTKTAARLAAFAISMQWVHVTQILLPLTTSGCTPAEAVHNIDACLPCGEQAAFWA